MDSGNEIYSYTSRIKSVCIFPNDEGFAGASSDGQLLLWNEHIKSYSTAVPSPPSLTVRLSQGVIRTVVYDEFHDMLLAGGDEGVMYAVSRARGEILWTSKIHSDYIRCFAIHDKAPVILTCGDDSTVRLFLFDSNGINHLATFAGCLDMVMSVDWAPDGECSFVCGVMDSSIRVYALPSPLNQLISDYVDRPASRHDILSQLEKIATAGPIEAVPYVFQFRGHDSCVNSVCWVTAKDRKIIISGSDDLSINVWDVNSRSVIRKLCDQDDNVSSVTYDSCSHTIIAVSEDGCLRVFFADTFELKFITYTKLGRLWFVTQRNNWLAIGGDLGISLQQVGTGTPCISFHEAGCLSIVKGNQVSRYDFRTSALPQPIADTNVVAFENIPFRLLGSLDFTPTVVAYSQNSRWLLLRGETDWAIFNANNLKMRTFGKCTAAAWTGESYVIINNREGGQTVALYDSNDVEKKSFIPGMTVENVYGNSQLFFLTNATEFSVYDSASSSFLGSFTEEALTSIILPAHADSSNIIGILTAKKLCLYVIDYNGIRVAIENNPQEISTWLNLSESRLFYKAREVNLDSIASATIVDDVLVHCSGKGRFRVETLTFTFELDHLKNKDSDKSFIVGHYPHSSQLVLCSADLQIILYRLEPLLLKLLKTISDGSDLTVIPELTKQLSAASQNISLPQLSDLLTSLGHVEVALEILTEEYVHHKLNLALVAKKTSVAYDILISHEFDKSAWLRCGMVCIEEGNIERGIDCLISACAWRNLLAVGFALSDEACLIKVKDALIEELKIPIISSSRTVELARAEVDTVKLDEDACELLQMTLYMLKEHEALMNLFLMRGQPVLAAAYSRAYYPSALEALVSRWGADIDLNSYDLENGIEVEKLLATRRFEKEMYIGVTELLDYDLIDEYIDMGRDAFIQAIIDV